MNYEQSFNKMKELILNGEIEQNFDFYGYALTYFDLEDTDKTANALVIALNHGEENGGFMDALKLFHKLVSVLKDDIGALTEDYLKITKQ